MPEYFISVAATAWNDPVSGRSFVTKRLTANGVYEEFYGSPNLHSNGIVDVIHNADSTVILVSVPQQYTSPLRPRLYRSTDYGETWAVVSDAGLNAVFDAQSQYWYNKFAFDGTYFYVFMHDTNAVWRSTDGASWSSYGTCNLPSFVLDSSYTVQYVNGKFFLTSDYDVWIAGISQNVQLWVSDNALTWNYLYDAISATYFSAPSIHYIPALGTWSIVTQGTRENYSYIYNGAQALTRACDWTGFPTYLDNRYVTGVAQVGNTLYMGAYNGNTTTYGYYSSIDGGVSWSVINENVDPAVVIMSGGAGDNDSGGCLDLYDGMHQTYSQFVVYDSVSSSGDVYVTSDFITFTLIYDRSENANIQVWTTFSKVSSGWVYSAPIPPATCVTWIEVVNLENYSG